MHRWALLAGAKGTGKTTRLLDVISRLRARGVRVGGVVQEAIAGPEGADADAREGYVARELAGEARATLARRARSGDESNPSAQQVCSFTFDAAALADARGWIERDAGACDVVVVDEVSKLEVGGGGHHDAVVRALAGRALPLLCVRADQLFAVMQRFALDEPVASIELGGEAVGEADVEAFVDAIARAVAKEARA